LETRVVVGAEFVLVPGYVVDCAGFMGAEFAGEDWVVDASGVELVEGAGRGEAVAVFGEGI